MKKVGINKEYIYNIGDKVNGYEIIEQTRTYYKNSELPRA